MAKGEAQVVDRRAPRLAAKLTLPSGKVVVMRELYGDEELSAIGEAHSIAGSNEAKLQLALAWASRKRSLVSIDGEPYDQSSRTATSFRDEFSSRDHLALGWLFNEVNGIQEGEFARFRDEIQWEAGS